MPSKNIVQKPRTRDRVSMQLDVEIDGSAIVQTLGRYKSSSVCSPGVIPLKKRRLPCELVFIQAQSCRVNEQAILQKKRFPIFNFSCTQSYHGGTVVQIWRQRCDVSCPISVQCCHTAPQLSGNCHNSAQYGGLQFWTVAWSR